MGDYCLDCSHLKICHDEDGICDVYQDDLDDMPGGAQGAHVSACPSQDPEINQDLSEERT